MSVLRADEFVDRAASDHHRLHFSGALEDVENTGVAKDTALLQLHIVPLSYMALGCAMTVNGALNALGKPMAAMWVSMSRTIAVYAPLAWLLSHFFHSVIGIFIAAASANFIAGGIGVYWLRFTLKDAMAKHPPNLVDKGPVEQRA